jgi:GAF domain-containing protein
MSQLVVVVTLALMPGPRMPLRGWCCGWSRVASALLFGFRAAVGVPVRVEGGLWGVMTVGSMRGPLPADTEARLAEFTELAATAISNAQARVELRGFADEQAALRRVATLVAQVAAPEEVFAAVTEEAGRLLHADCASMHRYDPDGTMTVVANWSSTGAAAFPVGTRARLGGRNVSTRVFQTGRMARVDDLFGGSGPVAEAGREFGIGAAVGVPVSVEGRLWGVMVVGSRAEPLPAGTEARLAGFTELAATAIANAEAQAALTASRARIVATADPGRPLGVAVPQLPDLDHLRRVRRRRACLRLRVAHLARWGHRGAV